MWWWIFRFQNLPSPRWPWSERPGLIGKLRSGWSSFSSGQLRDHDLLPYSSGPYRIGCGHRLAVFVNLKKTPQKQLAWLATIDFWKQKSIPIFWQWWTRSKLFMEIFKTIFLCFAQRATSMEIIHENFCTGIRRVGPIYTQDQFLGSQGEICIPITGEPSTINSMHVCSDSAFHGMFWEIPHLLNPDICIQISEDGLAGIIF